MLEQLTETLVNVNKEAAVVILSALPVSELRGAIPLGLGLGFSPLKTYALAYIGNMIPVIPLLFLFQPVSDRLRHIPFFERFFSWLEGRTRRKANLVEKYEALGLILFVAVPLPVTGAWTGCVAATLFKVRFRYALAAVMCGVAIAGLVVMAISLAGKGLLTG